jgi:hypothetical protein
MRNRRKLSRKQDVDMFNLIMGGEPVVFDRWPSMDPAKTKGEDSMSLSRMLEGTPTELYQRLIPVGEDTYKFLTKLPVLFMTEQYFDYDNENDSSKYVRVRLGEVSNLFKANDDICYTFKIKHDFGEIKNPKSEVFKRVLDLGSFGLNRTHWAVKDKDLKVVLDELGLQKVGRSRYTSIRPKLNKTKIKEIDNLKDFLDFVNTDNDNPDQEVFYRGHARISYELIPSLFRKHDNGTYKHLDNESFMVRELLTARPTEFAGDTYTIDKLVRMQHYGLPTRLLDITSNPLIALYFACCENPDEDGQVISFPTPRKEIKYFDSDTVSCIANLAFLPFDMLKKLSQSNKNFEIQVCIDKLVDYVKGEKSYFLNNIKPDDLRQILFLRGRINNERMQSQSGAFLLFGHDAVLPETTNDFPLNRVIVKAKKDILKQLAQLNITEGTVYPSMEKTASEIAKKYISPF